MAQVIFPPGGWKQQVNTIDSIELEYESPYKGVNLRMWCETVKGTGDWVWVDLPGPLASNGSYILHISLYHFEDAVSVWPTQCHFDLKNSENEKQVVNGGNLNLNTASASNVAETTYSRAGKTSTNTAATSTLALATSTGTATSTSGVTSGSGPTNAPSSDGQSKGLSSGARIGIGVGVGIGGLILLLLAVWAILFYRRRRRAQASKPAANQGYEKAELMGTNVPQGYRSGSTFGSEAVQDAKRYSETNQQTRWSHPQELMGSGTPANGVMHNSGPPQRYELA